MIKNTYGTSMYMQIDIVLNNYMNTTKEHNELLTAQNNKVDSSCNKTISCKVTRQRRDLTPQLQKSQES